MRALKHITRRAGVLRRRFKLPPSQAAVLDRLIDGPATLDDLALMLAERGMSASPGVARKCAVVHISRLRGAIVGVGEIWVASGGQRAPSGVGIAPHLRAGVRYELSASAREALRDCAGPQVMAA